MTAQKQVLIKADDYGRSGANLDPWRRFFDCLTDAGYVASVGVVAEVFGKESKAVSYYLRAMYEEYGFEIWNHSFTHSDFTTLKKDKIFIELNESQRVIENEIGYTPKIFGAPFNRINQVVVDAVLEANLFSGFYCFDNFVPRHANIERKYLSTLEAGTDKFRPVRPSLFHEEMKRREWPDFLVFQVHPYYWSSQCFEAFRKVLVCLQGKNYQCVTARDRLAYLRSVIENITPCPGKALADNLRYEEITKERIELEIKSGLTTRNDSAYYFRMLASGSSQIQFFLRKIGFFKLPKTNGDVVIIDVGSGIGNWTIAAALIPDSKIISVDREDRHLGYLSDNQNKHNISVEISSFDNLGIRDSSISGIVCNNTISYIDVIATLTKFSDVLCLGGAAYIGLQNRLYPLRDAIEAARRGEWDFAKAHFMRLVQNEAAKCGLVSQTFVRYWNSDELAALGAGCGLKLQRRGLVPPGVYGKFAKQDIFSGYLFVKTYAILMARDSLEHGRSENKLFQLIKATSNFPSSELGLEAIEEAVLIRSFKLFLDGRLDESSPFYMAARLVFMYLDDMNFNRLLEYHSRLMLLKDCFGFYISCKAIENGIRSASIVSFNDPMYDLLVGCFRAIFIRDPKALLEVAMQIENYVLKCDEAELVYWL